MDTDAMVSTAVVALRRAREIGIDSREIARESGVSDSAISQWSKGLRSISADNESRLRAALVVLLRRHVEASNALLADLESV